MLQSAIAEECKPWVSGDALDESNPVLNLAENDPLTIGTIKIETRDIFDLSKPDESRMLHKWANKAHIKTKDSVIKRQLLFKEGDIYQLKKLEESERLLRANRYIKDASVKAVEVCGKKVNIHVDTTDNWTLTPGVSFGRSGGNSKSGIAIEEHNLFGYGKGLSLSYKSATERDSTLLEYLDPQLFGSRVQLFGSIQNNSDGKGHEFDLRLPFYALDSLRSWGVHTKSIKQDTSVYEGGVVTDKLQKEKSDYSLFYGWSPGLVDNHTSRFKVGWQYNKDKTTNSPASFAQSIVESYPWLNYEYGEDQYIEKTNFRTMGKIEDVALGKSYTLGAGVLRQEFGSDDDYLRLNGQFSKGYELGEDDLGFISLGAISYLGDGPLSGEELSLNGEWYSFNEKGNDLYVGGRLAGKSNLLAGEQILLGGETGLRGYPTGYQSGDKSVLFTAEKRLHLNWYPLSIAKFGVVAFADTGTAWGDGRDPQILTDVGIGLRIVPTRSSSAKMLHLDLAVPMNDRDKVDGFQVLIQTKTSF